MHPDLIAAATATQALASTNSLNNTLVRALGEIDHLSSFVLLLLLGLSVASWAVIIERFMRFRIAERKINHFLEVFDEVDGNLDAVYQQARKGLSGSPAAYLFGECYKEAQALGYRDGSQLVLTPDTLSAVERVRLRALGDIQLALERWLVVLATTANVGPLFGLFGTVWGVLVAFHSLSRTAGAVGIDAIAPGISAALITTVFGLATAIPAAIAFNMFVNRVNVLLLTLDSFGGRLCSVLARHLDTNNAHAGVIKRRMALGGTKQQHGSESRGASAPIDLVSR